MKPSRTIATALVLTALAAAWAGGLLDAVTRTASAANSPGPAGGNASRGKAIFERNCVPCHKKDGTGGIRLLAGGNPSRNFRNPEFWKGRTDAELQKAIETGFPKSGMVSWKAVLRPHEIRDVIAYLRATFQPKETRASHGQAGEKSEAAPGATPPR